MKKRDELVQELVAAQEHRPVFLDPSGTRWRRIRVALISLTVVVAVGLGIAIPAVFSVPLLNGADPSRPLTRSELRHDAPVIGTGPMERVIRVERAGDQFVGVEPWTGERLADLTPTEVAALGDHRYAIQHFGYAEGTAKTVSITFDDGPSAVTPELLDLLSLHKVPATFFVVGREAIARPLLLQRMVREGHSVGIHTMTHPEFDELTGWLQQWELVSTERAVRALTGHEASFWRMPYDSMEIKDQQASIFGLAQAQRLGYQHASYDFDTLDWHVAATGGRGADIPLPVLEGDHVTILLHDGGGAHREIVLAYLNRLIPYARAQGYAFQTMPQTQPSLVAGNAVAAATIWDTVTLGVSQLMFVSPSAILAGVFWFSVVAVLVVGFLNVLLALWRRRRRKRIVFPTARDTSLPVSVVLAAYNEETVIARTLRSILASDYPITEVLVVDDGSSDSTADEVRLVASEDPRVRLLQQPNGGKSTALNNGVRAAAGEVVVTLDADTVMTSGTIARMVRHFALDEAGTLGGVAGVVRVGNRSRNMLTRWQGLEYVSQIGLDRSAQDALGAISIIPGACAAWRRTAILEAGGYSTDTLAEDCDLALSLHRHGWRVTQDDEALAYTEAPETVDALLTQRVRWTYGTLQAMWKHRSMLFRRHSGWLGWFVMPNYVLSFAFPIVFLPLVAFMALAAVERGEGPMLLAYWGAFMVVQVLLSTIAVVLMRDDPRHLLVAPVYRLIADPMRAYLLYTAVLLAVKGVQVGWNKLVRTGSIDGGASVVPAGSVSPSAVSAGTAAVV